MPTSPTELAREAKSQCDLLRVAFDLHTQRLDRLDLETMRDTLGRVEGVVTQLAQRGEQVVRLENRVSVLESQSLELKQARHEVASLREQVAVLKAEVAELKESKKQADNRVWNVLMISVGAVLSLLGGVVVQLVAFAIKK